jgi:hypothetical protein
LGITDLMNRFKKLQSIVSRCQIGDRRKLDKNNFISNNPGHHRLKKLAINPKKRFRAKVDFLVENLKGKGVDHSS